MNEPGSGSYQDELQACVAARVGVTAVSRHPVNHAMIGIWADALRDPDPVYVDDAAARATGRPGVIAPPTMIQAWSVPPLSQLAKNRSIPGCRPFEHGSGDMPQPRSQGPGAAAHQVLHTVAGQVSGG